MFGIYTRVRFQLIKLAENSQAKYFGYKKSSSTFLFRGKKYQYFIHPYNYTWRNERIIEIPIIKNILEEYQGKEILEVGNVMSHYMKIEHDVLDKYEKAEEVINQDVVDFRTNKKYDLIFSISTLEHVGWDEEKKDVKKVLGAVSNLKRHLNKGGKIIITHPLGYNKFMDEYIESGELGFDEIFLMTRVSEDNLWKQVPWKNELYIRYHYPYPYANGVVTGIFNKK